MRFDAETRSLVFTSKGEIEEFHRELTELLRQAMIDGTRRIEEPSEAKRVSQRVMRDLRATMSALNLLRRQLPKKEF